MRSEDKKNRPVLGTYYWKTHPWQIILQTRQSWPFMLPKRS